MRSKKVHQVEALGPKAFFLPVVEVVGYNRAVWRKVAKLSKFAHNFINKGVRFDSGNITMAEAHRMFRKRLADYNLPISVRVVLCWAVDGLFINHLDQRGVFYKSL